MTPIDFIRAHPPFDQLNEVELAKVAQALEPAQFPPGSHILARHGPASRFLYIIYAGAVRLEREGQVTQILEEGELFGYVSLLGHSSPSFDVIAEEEAHVYLLPADLFHPLLDHPAFAEFFLKGLSERLRRLSSLETLSPAGDLTTPVKALVTRPLVSIEPAASVAEAARAMRQERVSSILVNSRPPGIITDRDLRSRVLAEGLGPQTPLSEIMSRPVKSLPDDTPAYNALLFMLEENIHHLPLTRQGEIRAIITDTDLLRHQAKSPLYLLKRVERIADAEALSHYAAEIAGAVASLFTGGVEVGHISRVIAHLNDTLIRRLLRLAEAALGPPPAPYAWIVFGSEGRQEQTLLTDQDNALIYQTATPEAQAYFGELAGRVVNGLIQAGFPPCPGGYMATNWCYPLAEWEHLFRQWVQTPEPHALLEAAIFFDYRQAHGELVLDPLENILLRAGKQGLFLAHMAQAALEFQPPLGFFRRIRQEEDGLDLKKGGITPIVGLARLYALQAGTLARSTLTRLEAAGQAGTLSSTEAETLAEAFRFILHLRLRAQLRAYQAGELPGNRIRLEALSALERRHLKEAFLAIRETQEMAAMQFQAGRLG